MTFCSVNLTQQGREKLFATIVALNIIQMLLGFLLIYISITAVTWKPTPHEKNALNAIYIIAAFIGVLVAINYIIGINTVNSASRSPHKKSSRRAVSLWLSAGFAISIIGLLLASVCPVTSTKVIANIRSALVCGLRNYLIDPVWHEMLDEMQQELSCCGIDGFVDWHRIPWIRMDFLNKNSETVTKFAEGDNTIFPPSTPWSCCRQDYELPCFHDPIQQSRYSEVWEDPELMTDSLHQEGCATAASRPIKLSLIAIFILNLLIFIIQIVITILSRLLFTSARNAIVLGDKNGMSPGWIFCSGFDIHRVKHKKLKSDKFKKNRRRHDPVADISLGPEETVENDTADSDAPLPEPKRSRTNNDPFPNATDISDIDSSPKNKDRKHKKIDLGRLKKFPFSDKIKRARDRKEKKRNEDKKEASPKIKVLMKRKFRKNDSASESLSESEFPITKLGKTKKFSFKIPRIKKRKNVETISTDAESDFTRVDSPRSEETPLIRPETPHSDSDFPSIKDEIKRDSEARTKKRKNASYPDTANSLIKGKKLKSKLEKLKNITKKAPKSKTKKSKNVSTEDYSDSDDYKKYVAKEKSRKQSEKTERSHMIKKKHKK